MSVAELLFEVMAPVVLIVALGAVAGPRLGFDAGTLSRLAYWVLGPAFMFSIFAHTDLDGATAGRLGVTALAGILAASLVAYVTSSGLRHRPKQRSATLMSSAYGNVGNAGLAISAFALGEDILDRASVLMLVGMMTGTVLGIWLATADQHGGVMAIRRAFVSPLVVAAGVALAVNAANVQVPAAIDRSTGLVGGALIPVMLLTLGLSLATAKNISVSSSAAVVMVAKLLVAPAAAYGVATLLGLTDDTRAVATIQASMPPAVFCVLLAMEFDLEPDQTTNDVVVATLASLVSLPIVLAFVT